MSTTLRPAEPADVSFIFDNIRGLAAAEGRPECVTITTDRLTEILFTPGAACRCYIIEVAGVGAVGHAWVYTLTPTFTGGRVLYLEDLYIREDQRGRGAGRDAMALLAALARRDGCDCMDWSMVEGNARAGAFYDRLGANRKSGSVTYRLSGPAFRALADTAWG